ncbi:MAG: methyltransferase domain-containing protein [Solirubrobacterales bacterium]|nr:methyltransferase domain-containing protein [Solirubrobacterales bacterium]
MRARTLLGAAALATLGAALWWRKNPSACPYGQRFWVEAPHPIITRERLRAVLRPAPGERLLEIGPGTGYYTLEIAEWVGGGSAARGGDAARGDAAGDGANTGTVEIFDLQQEFLDHTMSRAAERGLQNVVPTRGDATALPYEDASIDAVVLTAVLGEIPDPAAALREIRRVLKPAGRLIVGELFGDPHFTTLASLRRQAAETGFAYEDHSGNRLAYFARLSAPQ